MYHYFQILECARIYPTSVIKIRALTIKATDASFLFCPNDALYNKRIQVSIACYIQLSCLFNSLQSGIAPWSFLSPLSEIQFLTFIKSLTKEGNNQLLHPRWENFIPIRNKWWLHVLPQKYNSGKATKVGTRKETFPSGLFPYQ